MVAALFQQLRHIGRYGVQLAVKENGKLSIDILPLIVRQPQAHEYYQSQRQQHYEQKNDE